MNRYTFKLGNTIDRKGHRRDCSAVVMTVQVLGTHPTDALARLKHNATASPWIWTGLHNANGYVISVQLNADAIRESDIIACEELPRRFHGTAERDAECVHCNERFTSTEGRGPTCDECHAQGRRA